MAKARGKDTENVVSLERYRAKRDFTKTPEPDVRARADEAEREGHLFCVQQHAARRRHYDLRLQLGDALKSWAVPQGPSLDPKVRRLAVHVEDHPLDYARFEGAIPKGQYGAGEVIVWDIGQWVPMGDAQEGYRKGSLKFRLSGEKLNGGWTLVRIKRDQEKADNWLLIKERDLFARPEAEGDICEEHPESVLSGRTIEALKADEEEVAPAKARPKPKPKGLRPNTLPRARKEARIEVPRPQLASLVAAPPGGDDWLHEIKLDGYRTLARIEEGETRLITRSGHDWTDRYRALAQAFGPIPCRQALIDGEVVVQNDEGLSSFAALQDALSEGASHKLTFFAFDLLHLDGYDLREVPLARRKEALHTLLEGVITPTSALQFSEHVLGQGRAFFDQAARMGLEGVISKRVGATYQPGRSKSWLKAKCVRSDEFLIVGYTESEAASGIASLLLAEAGDRGLRYAGRVGTGYSGAEAVRLQTRLEPLARKTPPVAMPPEEKRKAIFVKPALLAQVRYMNRTADGILRHAVYQGLREDKQDEVAEAAAAREPEPEPTPRKRLITDADLASIWVTNPDRRMFSADGPTKLELALYYARVGDWMLPEVLRRPTSLVRCPTGTSEDCFFQRHAMPGMPDVVKIISLREERSKKRGDYLYFEDARGFLSLPQFGAIELHSWGCRIDQPERPDRMIFDLDPDESLRWSEVIDAALEVRGGLEALGLAPFVKTTGGKGLHLVVPLQRRQGWERMLRFAQAFVEGLAKRAPTRFTGKMAKSGRRGRVFIDYLRNVRGATAVAPYSLRARPGVPASTPVHWGELSEIDDPADLNYATVAERLGRDFADPWANIDQAARALTQEMERQIGISA
jgi:bifunctional non-homologous end joining protein LigD